ncbi:MAG: XTP/dITP diphosphatase [Actinomycetota bacterium]
MSARRLVLATGNRGKIGEIRAVLSGLDIGVVTSGDLAGWPDLEEKGDTFEENAASKALTLARWAAIPALADDSGLEVEALGGRPGVLSARYAGRQGDDAANIARVLREMEGIQTGSRGARFVCVLVLASPGGEVVEVRDTCEGHITTVPRGERGFGYDPVFIAEGLERTMAELSMEEKNAVSHRGKALRRLRSLLERGEPAWFFDLVG